MAEPTQLFTDEGPASSPAPTSSLSLALRARARHKALTDAERLHALELAIHFLGGKPAKRLPPADRQDLLDGIATALYASL